MSQVGIVVRWNDSSGFGFIAQGEGNPDIFVHRSSLLNVDMLHLKEEVTYEAIYDDGKSKWMAVNVTSLAAQQEQGQPPLPPPLPPMAPPQEHPWGQPQMQHMAPPPPPPADFAPSPVHDPPLPQEQFHPQHPPQFVHHHQGPPPPPPQQQHFQPQFVQHQFVQAPPQYHMAPPPPHQQFGQHPPQQQLYVYQ